MSSRFKLIKVDGTETAFRPLDNDETVQRGALVKQVTVRARLRPFWDDTASYWPWSATLAAVRQGGHKARPLQRVFTFSDVPERAVFTADVASGSIMAYEARKQEMVGQLDYLVYAAKVCEGLMKVFALEIGEGSMLLLEQAGEDAFRRVGMVTSYRPDFFEGVSETRELVLV